MTYGKDLNQLQTLNVTLPLLSAAEELLVIEGNDLRALADGTEKWYGQIRNVGEDPYLNMWDIYALGKAVRAHDRAWATRREWVNLPPEVIADEVLGNMMDEELRAGLVLFYDMESLTDAGLMEDLSVGGNDGTITGTASIVAKWGLGRDFSGATTDKIRIALIFDGFTGWTLAGFGRVAAARAGETNQTIIKNVISTADAQGSLALTGPAGGTPTTIQVEINTATQGYQAISRAFTFVLGTVYHIAATWDGSNVRIYVDGIQQGAAVAATGALVSGNGNTDIGHYPAADSETFNDWLDQPLIYNRGLSAAQVLALAGRSIYEGGLLADSFELISFRAEEDARLSIVDGICKVIGADWFTDRDGDDRDRFRMVPRRGLDSAQDSFQLGMSVIAPIKHETDRETVRNDVTALGYGDGQNQLRSRIWHATTIRDVLTVDYPENDTGPISIVDASSWPTNGTMFLGMERVDYTGKSSTQVGTTSVTRAYVGDGYESLDAYNHSEGIAVWLHVDTTTTPDTTYDPSSPQTGSSIEDNGHRQGWPFVDRGIIDQGTLDFLAQRLLNSYKDPRDSVWLKVQEEDIAADVGDDVDLLDFGGSALFDSPYRIFALEFDRPSAIWSLDLGSPRDVAEAELARIREELRLTRSYGQGATNEMTMVFFDNIKGATTPPGIPLTAIFETPKDAKAVNEVRVLTLAMQAFRSYVGGPDIARTSSELSTGSHSHTYDRPSHQHGAAGSLDIPDAITTEDGTPLHDHPVTYVAHTVPQHDSEDPAGQQTNPREDGVGHNHGGNVGPHSHGAPAASSAQATIGTGVGGAAYARPDSDILVDEYIPKPSSPTTLWDKLDEVSPNDSTDFVFTIETPTSGTARFRVGLTNVTDPVVHTGHVIKVRTREFDLGGSPSQVVELRQGSTLIKSLNITPVGSWHTTTYTLSEAEAALITDYTALAFWVSAAGVIGPEGDVVYVTWMEFSVPVEHTHTVSDDDHTHGSSDSTDLGDPTSGNSGVSGSHDHSLNPDGAGHVHGEPSDGSATGTTGVTLGHSHTWSIANHDHGNLASFNEPGLTVDTEDDSFHDHSMQGHTHVAGIFETAYLSPNVGIRIDGTDRTTALGGPWAGPVEVDIDITEFVQDIGTHTLEFFEGGIAASEGKLGRLFAAVLIKFFIQSGVGG